jgi:hypothetical protein
MAKTIVLMNSGAVNFVKQAVEIEAREQLRNLPRSFRKYRSEIDFQRLTDDAIELLPRSFRALGEQYHDRQMRQLRIRIAVERAIANLLQERKLYYIARIDLEDDDDIPTEPIEELVFSR